MTTDTLTRVRDLTRSDFDDLRVLMQELHRGGDVPEGDAGEAILYEILALPGTSLIGAEVDRRIVSTAMVSIVPNLTFGGRPLARVENVVTLPAFRSQGLARAVMDEAVARARRADCANLSLLMERTLDAEGFYRKLGFKDDQLGLVLHLGDGL